MCNSCNNGEVVVNGITYIHENIPGKGDVLVPKPKVKWKMGNIIDLIFSDNKVWTCMVIKTTQGTCLLTLSGSSQDERGNRFCSEKPTVEDLQKYCEDNYRAKIRSGGITLSS